MITHFQHLKTQFTPFVKKNSSHNFNINSIFHVLPTFVGKTHHTFININLIYLSFQNMLYKQALMITWSSKAPLGTLGVGHFSAINQSPIHTHVELTLLLWLSIFLRIAKTWRFFRRMILWINVVTESKKSL